MSDPGQVICRWCEEEVQGVVHHRFTPKSLTALEERRRAEVETQELMEIADSKEVDAMDIGNGSDPRYHHDHELARDEAVGDASRMAKAEDSGWFYDDEDDEGDHHPGLPETLRGLGIDIR